MPKKLFHSSLYSFIALRINQRNSYYLYHTFIKGRLNVAKLYLSLGDLPVFIEEHPTINLDNYKVNDRALLSINSDTAEDNIEIIVRKLLPKTMPFIYWEAFGTLLKCVDKTNLPNNVKVIVTTIGIWKDDFFKSWVAQQVQKGVSLVVGQHGGEYGTCLFSSFEEHEIKISDKYLSWGWGHNNDIIPAPVPQLFLNREKTWDRSGNISIICKTLGGYVSQMHSSSPINSKGTAYLEDMHDFFNLLSDDLKKIILVKLFHDDAEQGRPVRNIIKNNFSDVMIAQDNDVLENILVRSRLGVHTYNGTTFLESIAFNRPCMLMADPMVSPIRMEAQPHFDRLSSVGIYHKTPESAINKIIEVVDDIESWWNDKDVASARENFCSQFALTVDDPVTYYANILRNIKNVTK